MTTRYVLGVMAFMLAAATIQAQDGKTLYEANCKKCHGVIGIPPKTIQKKYEKIPFFNAEFAAKVSDDSIVKVLTKGGKTDDMKSFKDVLSHEEMTAVAKYVRELATKPKAPSGG
jgi:mono/diheme cytochrome c family protein